MNRSRSKLLASLLSLALVVSMTPSFALAQEGSATGEGGGSELSGASNATADTLGSAAPDGQTDFSGDANQPPEASGQLDSAGRDEQQDSVLEQDIDLNEVPRNDAAVSDVAYVYVESPEIAYGGSQNIVIGLADGVSPVSNAELTLRSETGREWIIAATSAIEGAVLFSIDTAGTEEGSIELIGFSYSGGLAGRKMTEELFQYTDVHYSFRVVHPVSSFAEEADLGEVTVYSLDNAGILSKESNLENAIENAQTGQENGSLGLATPSKLSRGVANRASDIIVALDPGHGGSDGGASGFGLLEKSLNLKIAKYCQQELESYSGVRVVMTRTGDEYVGLLDRVARAVQQGASVFVSIHCNASGGTGAEVYIPNGSSYQHQTHITGEALATKILQQITSLGLANRGVKVRDSEYYQGSGPYYYEDGHLADFYTVINESREYGIPGIIVEHAFVDNASDAAFLSSESNLRALGVADATGIAQQYGLSKSRVEVASEIRGSVLELDTRNWGVDPGNVCFSVLAPTGETTWVQGYEQNDGSWTGSIDLGVNYGIYDVCAYATIDGTIKEYKHIDVGYNKTDMTAERIGDVLVLRTSNWGVSPDNVSFSVVDPTGAIDYCQGIRQQDGSWSCEKNIAGGSYGNYEIKAWCSLDKGVSGFSVSSASVSVAEPVVAFEASVSNGTLELSASGFTLTPSNVCFPVTAPNGGPTKWYQGYRQADGSWTGSADLGADFGAYGDYSVQAYATYAGECLPRASASVSVAEPVVAFEASVSNGTLELSASGFTLTPSNVCFPVTAPNGGPTKWYQGYRQADGSWTGSADLGADFGAYGDYSVQAYATYAGECLPRASASVSVVKELDENEQQLTLKAAVSVDQKTVTIEAYGGRLGASSAVTFPVWSDTGGQDDMIWYSASYSFVDGRWRATVPISAHKTSGLYNVHMYGTVFGEPVWSSTTFTIDEPKATVSIENQNEELGTFAVAVKDLSSPSGVSNVKVPIWSAADQSDIKWYSAIRQPDGSWRVLVNIRDHKYSMSSQREYSIHVYLTAGNEITSLIGATSIGMQYKGSSGYGIMGVSNVSASQMAAFFNSKSKRYPTEVYSPYGAATIEQFCTILCEEASVEGVRAEVVFAQAMKETGYLQFGGDVKAEQCNFAGIGATGNGVPGNSFADVRTGLRAQVQHLKAYASTEDLVQVCVDPRFGYVQRGCAPTVEALSGKWAASQSYGVELVALIAEVMKVSPTASLGLTYTALAEDGLANNAVSPKKIDGIDYLFLPAGADLSNLVLCYEATPGAFVSISSASGEDIAIESGVPFDLVALFDSEEKASYSCDLTIGSSEEMSIKLPLKIMQSSGVGSVFMNSDDPDNFGRDYIESSIDHSAKATGYMNYFDENFSLVHSASLKQIKGRGNSTWLSTSKKSYQVKFDKKASLIRPDEKDEKNKTWLLLANSFDPTLSHNLIAYRLAAALGLNESPECEYVDLYYDGDYRGSYLLCEKVEVASGRVDIENMEAAIELANATVDDFDELPVNQGVTSRGGKMQWVEGLANPGNNAGGYLLELDTVWGVKEKSWFVTSASDIVVLKNPEYAPRSQVDYISSFVEEIIQCVNEGGVNSSTGKSLFEYIDRDSFVKYYFVQNWTGNADFGRSSVYFFKPQNEDKLYAGPVWDFDTSLGVVTNGSEVGWAGGGWFSSALFNVPAFKAEFKKSSLNTMLPLVTQQSITFWMNNIQKTLDNSQEMNYLIWDFDDRDGSCNPDDTFYENINTMYLYAMNRYLWLLETVNSFD